MKKLLTLTLLIWTSNSFGQTMTDSLRIKAENNQNPAKWDNELFKNEIEWSKTNYSEPLKVLAFPVEKYDTYVFSKPFRFNIQGLNFSGISVGENIGAKNKKYELRHDLTLIFCTKDSIIDIESFVSSRNSPYISFQGSLKLNVQYDFVGVKSPDEKGFLMVSTKAFDLQFGQTIIIFPNSNNSFYYLQLKEKPAISEIVNEFMESIKSEKFNNFINLLKTNDKILSMIKYVDNK